MKKIQKIAFFLPQFHEIEENNIWWGTGFTEWFNVRKAKPIFERHYQPHIPLKNNYYDLSDMQNMIQQSLTADEYGITGFCFYHYWFNGKKLLEKPIENILESTDYHFPFMLCWANENWTRRWDGKNKEVLIQQSFSNYDYHEHAEYLSRFFLDSRYIRIDNKPVFMIYKPDEIPELNEFILKLRLHLKAFNIYDLQILGCTHGRKNERLLFSSGIDHIVDFMPNSYRITSMNSKLFDIACQILFLRRKYLIHKFFPKFVANIVISYTKLVSDSMRKPIRKNYFPCVFPSWDNTARRNLNSTIIQNKDARLFKRWIEHNLKELNLRSEQKNADEILFFNAWNEWAEGCHLEPDEEMKFAFLEAVKECTLESEKSL